MMFAQLFRVCLCCLLASLAYGDVAITGPRENAIFVPTNGKVSITISWIDNHAFPTMDMFTYFTFVLGTGTNTNITSIKTLAKKIPLKDIIVESTNYSYTLEIDADTTGDGQYFIQIFGWAVHDKSSGYTIHYSHRFTLTSMTGSTSYTYTNSIPPDAQTSIVTQASQASVNPASFTLSYYDQTGISRFAPMQTPPGSSVTATTWSRRFPSSAVTYYTSLINSLQQQTTITLPWSGSLTSDYNYATPAAFPSDNGGWYDPADRISLTPRKVNYRRV